MLRFRSLALLWTAALGLGAGALLAVNTARIYGTITDETGKPVGEAKITVTCPSMPTFKLEAGTDSSGRWAVTLVDATKTYHYRFEKVGYLMMEQELKLPIGANERRDFKMLTVDEARRQGIGGGGQPTNAEQAVLAFNAGAEAYQQGDTTTAKAKMQEAISIDPQLTAGYSALAALYWAEKDATKALEMAERALSIDPKDVRALRVSVQAYTAQGDREKTKAAVAALAAADPKAGAADLYEQGRLAYNAGDMATALKLFEQSVAGNPDFPRVHYMLGMCYINQGDTAKAKQELETFIATASADDPDLGTAKEMLAYLK